MNSDISIILPLGEVILTREWLRIVSINISDKKLYADLVIINMQDFDVILRMNLLSKYNAIIHCHEKKVEFHPMDK